MKITKYFIALTAIVLVMKLNQPLTRAQISQVLLAKMSDTVFVQRSPLRKSQPMELAVAQPPVEGRPDERIPAGTRAT